MACPELVQMERIEKGGEKIIGIGSMKPCVNASAEYVMVLSDIRHID